ncbi:MAG: hypothetical protein HY680_08910 [Chloroflexi bacterium]|nr:hypothetical protein [Chloroflexota bacterium]
MLKRWLVVAVTSGLLALAFMPTANGQQATLRLSGQVVNGTSGAAIPQGLQVLLTVVRPEGGTQAPSAAVDSSGGFVFEGIPSDASLYSLATTYLDIRYGLDVGPADDLSAVKLLVYEASSSMEQISFARSSLLVSGVNAEDRRLSFLELMQVVNAGDRTFVPDQSQGMVFLRFPLPPGAADLDVQADLPEGQAIQIDRGFAITSPVPPGEHTIGYSYNAPYQGGAFELSRTYLSGAGTFRALVPESLGQASSSNLSVQRGTMIGDQAYWLLEGANIAPGGSVNFRIQGLPQPGLWDRARSLGSGNLRYLAAPLALAMGLAVLLLVWMFRRGGRAPVEAAAQVSDRDALLRAIAALDDRRAAGQMEEEAYQEQRSALKAQLLRLTTQEAVEP